MLASHFNETYPRSILRAETQTESISFMTYWACSHDSSISHPFWPALGRRLCASGEHPPARTVQTLHGRAIPVKRNDHGSVRITHSWPLRNETFSSCRRNQLWSHQLIRADPKMTPACTGRRKRACTFQRPGPGVSASLAPCQDRDGQSHLVRLCEQE